MVAKSKIKRLSLLAMTFALFLATFAAPYTPMVKAATDTGIVTSDVTSGTVLDHQLYRFLKHCFYLIDINETGTAEARNWEWFRNGDVDSGDYSAGDSPFGFWDYDDNLKATFNGGNNPFWDSVQASGDFSEGSGGSTKNFWAASVRGGMYEQWAPRCDDGWAIKEAFSRFGFTNGLVAFCSLRFTYNEETGGNGKNGGTTQDCIDGASTDAQYYGANKALSTQTFDEQGAALDALLQGNRRAQVAKGNLADWAKYEQYYRTMFRGCSLSLVRKISKAESIANNLADRSNQVFELPVVKLVDNRVVVEHWLASSSGNINSDTVIPLSSVATNTNTSFYPNARTFTYKTCLDFEQALQAGESIDRESNLARAYVQYVQENKDDQNFSGLSIDDAPDDSDTPTGGADATCSAKEWGWIMCPIINMVGYVSEEVAKFLERYLATPPLSFSSGPLVEGWGRVRAVANAFLIIGFLVVVFSQATSYNLSAYGVKRMMPRLVAAAILINLSFFICAILVDISNILGANITEMITSAGGTGSGGMFDTVGETVGTIIGGGVAVAGLVILAAIFFVPILLAMLTVVLVLAARTAIITLLIFIAPLAFAAWILPNTEKYFKKWWDLFLQMLLVYPAVMALFAASSVAAALVANASGGDIVPMLIALLIQALPLLALPALIKLTSGVLGKLDAQFRTGGNKIKSGYEKTALGREAAMRKQSRENARQRRYLEGKGVGGRLASGRRRISGIGTTGVLGTVRPSAAAGNMLMADQIDSARRKLAEERIDSIHRNMSGNIASGFSEGLTAAQMRQQSNAGTRFTSAEDKAALEYLDKSGLSKKPDASLAIAATRKVFDIENIPKSGVDANGNPTGPEVAMQNLAKMVGSSQADNRRLSEEISSGASKHGYKNLAYGNVTDGTFTNYTEAGKTPQAIVDGGLTGVNKDMLDDVNIQKAIEAKVARPADQGGGRAAQLELIQQTMHITKDASLATLAKHAKVDINELKAVRQSIASNGTVPMPPGW